MNGHSMNGNSMNGHSMNGHSMSGGSMGERPFEEVDAQRAQLEADITAALGRTSAANERLAARDAAVRAALQAELLESKATLARLEQEYEMAIAMVQQAARDEVDRIMATARQQVVERRRAVEANEGSRHVE